MKELTYIGHVTETGDIQLPKRIRKEVGQWLRGKAIEVIFRRQKRIRSSEQNRYYWGVVLPYALQGFIDAGNPLQYPQDLETVHSFFKSRYIPGRTVADAHGEEHQLPPTTTDLGKSDFADYLAQIAQFCAEYLNTVIPEPGEQIEIF